MGVISTQLEYIKQNLDMSKDSVNTKYAIMEMPQIDNMTIGQLPPAIDDIPVVNSNDATATTSDILENKTAYIKNAKVIGAMKNWNIESSWLELSFVPDSEQPAHTSFKLRLDGSNYSWGYMADKTRFKLDKSEIATKAGLIPSVLKKGITILDVTGTYEGMDGTSDATAGANDIIKGKTAYVNKAKVIGTLIDNRGKTVTPAASVKSNTLYVTLPEEAAYDKNTVLGISYSKLATLLDIKPENIKKGETILGITGTYEGVTGNTEVPTTPDIEFDEDDGTKSYYNYDAPSWLFHAGFKWGLYEILLEYAPGNYSNTAYHTAYVRMYNAYFHNGQHMDGYFVQYRSDMEKTYHNCFYEINGKQYLTCYVGDLDLTVDEYTYIYKCMRYDSPELIMKFSGFMYISNSRGYVDYLLFDNFDEATRQSYQDACFETFKRICPLIYAHYGIDVSVPYQSFLSSVTSEYYTKDQKLKIAKVIHDYLVLNNNYHDSSVPYLDQTMYPALSRGAETPVCASYAHAFQWCCQKFGIMCYVVNGSTDSQGNARHLWNMINYERYDSPAIINTAEPGIWVECDVTWDDPTGAGPSYCTWQYFNVTTDYIQSAAGGNRRRSYRGVTDNGNEAYYTFIVDTCTNSSYTYNGNTQYGGW